MNRKNLLTTFNRAFSLSSSIDKQSEIFVPANIFDLNALKNDIVKNQLGEDAIDEINHYLDKYNKLLPDDKDNRLVHADFDPSNILVDKMSGQDDAWKITGILDWEFAFSGSILSDIANMLRYSHKMPAEYEESFLKGLIKTNIILPKNWRVTINLLNILSLLDCLNRGKSKKTPNRCRDICELVRHILKELDDHKD